MFNAVSQGYFAQDDDLSSGASFNGIAPLSYNPLDKKVGETVTFRDTDLCSLSAEVTQISTSEYIVDGETYRLTDYELVAQQTTETIGLADQDGFVRLKLRCIPLEDRSFETAAFQSQCLDENANAIFTKLCMSGRASLEDASGTLQEGFTRIDGATAAYLAERVTVGDPTKGSLGNTEISHHTIKSLDYQRETTDASGAAFTQWGIVEFNPKTNAMVTLFGWSIDSKDIA